MSGTAVYTTNRAGLLTGSVLDGGTVNLVAERGGLVTEAGSRIDFSGTSAPIDVTYAGSSAAPIRTQIASAGGTLNLFSPEEISLRGSFKGRGGVGTAQRRAVPPRKRGFLDLAPAGADLPVGAADH